MKTKRYWLRGGVFGFIAYIALFIFNLFNSCCDAVNSNFVSHKVAQGIIFFPQGNYPRNPTFFQEYWFIGPIVFYVVVGIIVGIIYGKIKNRNKIS